MKTKKAAKNEKTETSPSIHGFKGFDKNLKCRGMQFKVGETHKHEGPVKACSSGFHFCEHPLDVFGYYPPGESRFASVVGSGDIDRENTDTKVSCANLHIEAEVDFTYMVKAAVKFVFDRATWTKEKTVTNKGEGAVESGDSGAASATGDSGAASATGYSGAASATGYSGAASATGDSGAASATGYRGAASATGDSGAASATGYSGAASATGENGIASSLGIYGVAKGAVGVWLVLSEWKLDSAQKWQRADVKTVLVDGVKIKADTFYILTDGEFVEAHA